MSTNSILATAPLVTTNFLLRATGTTIGNSLIFDNGTNVGIGTTSPAYTLDVSGTGRFSGKLTSTQGDSGTIIESVSTTTGYLNMIRATSTGSNLAMWIENSTGGNRAVGSLAYAGGLATYTSTALQFGTNNNIRATITTLGDLGIGTSSPVKHGNAGYKTLTIQGPTTNRAWIEMGTESSTTGSEMGVLTTFNASQARVAEISFTTGSVSSSGNVSISTMNASVLSGKMTVTNEGYVLIGTTDKTSGANLVIGGTSGTARVLPITDNVGYVGDSSHRWQAIYAVNGSILTSDEREKKDITNSDLGLDFINALRPVSYKWIVGENIVTEEFVEDETGFSTKIETITPRAGKRTHYGLISQEVEKILDGKDFGGFIYDLETDRYSLRYDEFISPLIKAIQELSKQNEELSNRLIKLESK
jgi:hypothetical protein